MVTKLTVISPSDKFLADKTVWNLIYLDFEVYFDNYAWLLYSSHVHILKKTFLCTDWLVCW